MKMRSSRREFLKLSAFASASLYAAPLIGSAQELVRSGRPKRVLVIGGGLAGLTAAYELSEAGHDVTVLEAQGRHGGRVRTLRDPFADGLYAELGAARIPENHAWTMKYVKLFGLKLVPFYPSAGRTSTFLRNVRIDAEPGEAPDINKFPVHLTQAELASGVGGLVDKAFGEALHAAENRSSWPPPGLADADRMTVREFMRSKGLSADAYDAIGLQPFGQASALEAITIMSNGHSAKQLNKIDGGNDQLPKAFAERLAGKITYGAPVLKIEQTTSGVAATYTQNGGSHRVTADKLICTIPFSVLRKVEIAPQFSPLKARAIREMTYGSLSRVTIQVKDRYWLREGLSGFANTDVPGEIWSSTHDRPGTRGLMQLYLMGPSSERASRMSEAQRHRFATAHVDRVFPGLGPNIEYVTSHCWDNDPWAGGATRLLNVGGVTAFHEASRRPEGHIHFAGEHTSTWFGWMNGAIESGSRAAIEVNSA